MGPAVIPIALYLGASATTAATIGAVATSAATVATVGIGAYSAYSTDQAAKQQASYQQGVARNNQIIAQQMADDARARGDEAARQQRVKSSAAAARQRVALAASGVIVGTGSALDLQSDTIALGEADALTIRSNAEREALGFEARGSGFASEAELFGLQADQANIDTALGVGSTLLTGGAEIGSVAAKWLPKKSTTPTPNPHTR